MVDVVSKEFEEVDVFILTKVQKSIRTIRGEDVGDGTLTARCANVRDRVPILELDNQVFSAACDRDPLITKPCSAVLCKEVNRAAGAHILLQDQGAWVEGIGVIVLTDTLIELVVCSTIDDTTKVDSGDGAQGRGDEPDLQNDVSLGSEVLRR